MKCFLSGIIGLQALFYIVDSQLIEYNEDKIKNDSQLKEDLFKTIYNTAKNISHSKGHLVYTDGSNPEYRRSLIHKIELKTNSLALRKVLGILKNCTDEDMIPTLEALKLLVHEYDTAISFMNNGGIEIIVPLIKINNNEIASASLSVLSAAMQGNPIVQNLAADYKVIGMCMAISTLRNEQFLSSLLFTISSYLRNMPKSQLHFFQENGIIFLSNIIKSKHSEKIRLHSIAILADLASEIMEGSNMNYQKLQLIKLFILGVQVNNVCKEISGFLNEEKHNDNKTVHAYYNFHEKFIHAMIGLQKVCAQEFKNRQVKSSIEKLIIIYDPLDNTHPVSKIDKELKILMHKQLQQFHEEMYSKLNKKEL